MRAEEEEKKPEATTTKSFNDVFVTFERTYVAQISISLYHFAWRTTDVSAISRSTIILMSSQNENKQQRKMSTILFAHFPEYQTINDKKMTDQSQLSLFTCHQFDVAIFGWNKTIFIHHFRFLFLFSFSLPFDKMLHEILVHSSVMPFIVFIQIHLCLFASFT